MKHALVPALLGLLAFSLAPLSAGERGAARLDQALRDLAGEVRVACLAAHPDDEDSETLALLRKKHGAATTVVFFTRGEGGQNEIGDQLWEDLAVVRTRESLAACDRIGAGARFLDFPDFGYSKTAEETFENWGREETVRRLVRALREIRPHVVVTNHGTVTGHGHHQAVGIAALEAFELAADPEAFPGEGPPWRVLKFFVRSEPADATARPDTGEVDPVRGLSYAEMGLLALKEHRSQGTWDFVTIEPGPRIRPYRLVKSRLPGDTAAGLLAGLPVPAPEWLEEENRTGTRAAILARLTALPPSDRRDGAIAAALGVELTLDIPDDPTVPGGPGRLRATLFNRGLLPVAVRSLSFGAAGAARSEGGMELAPGGALVRDLAFRVPAEVRPNRPLAAHLRDAPDESLRAFARAFVGPTDGEVSVPVDAAAVVGVFPPVTVTISDWGRLLRPVLKTSELAVVIQNHGREEREVELEIEILGTSRIAAKAPPPVRIPPGEQVTVGVTLRALSELVDGLYGVTVRTPGAPPATAPIRVLDAEVPPDLRVGVVRTYGDETWRALRTLGVQVDLLSDEDLAVGDLSVYRTIWLGIRPFVARPVLAEVQGRLLDYVREGGNLVVNYSKDREWREEFAPYRLVVGRERVTREDADLDFARPGHRLFTFPNEVRPEDFDGWIQERGLYFPAEWDSNRYEALLTTFDPGERPVPGLLVASYGRGSFVYTCLGWYRQLRILNPAALKMVANLAAYPWRN